MKTEKVFVRYKNLKETPPYNKERNEKRPNDKKKYAQKSTRPRQALKTIYDSFQPITNIPPLIQKLLTIYPKFFNKQAKAPEKENNESLNEFLILNRNKFMDILKEPKKQIEHLSSSDPDWNSDEEFDGEMESRKIDQTIVEKIVEKLGDRHVKKTENLKPHEKRFLEDYYRQKRSQEQQQNVEAQPPTKDNKSEGQKINQKDKKPHPEATKSKPNQNQNQEKPRQNIWSQYQQRQVNTFVDLGFMTKVDDNEEEITAQVAEDDDMFKEDFDEQSDSKSANQPSEQSQEEEDDIFGDEHPTTTIKTKKEVEAPKVQTQKIKQGTVMINDYLFSKIAESIGLLPVRCNWIIKNDLGQKFKVTTEYMDAYYRKQKMYEMFPLISLNHSDFISNDKVETAEGLQILRDYNYRLKHQNNYSYQQRNYKYKEKHFTHLKKK